MTNSFTPATPEVGFLCRPSEILIQMADDMGEGTYDHAKKRLLDLLRSGDLTAYVHLIQGNRYYRIPCDFYQVGSFADLRLSDKLFSFSSDGVPPELSDQDVVIDSRDVARLLNDPVPPKRASPPRVRDPQLLEWVKMRLQEGMTGREVYRATEAAFPGYRRPEKQRVADTYKTAHCDDLGEPPGLGGALHPVLKARRTKP